MLDKDERSILRIFGVIWFEVDCLSYVKLAIRVVVYISLFFFLNVCFEQLNIMSLPGHLFRNVRLQIRLFLCVRSFSNCVKSREVFSPQFVKCCCIGFTIVGMLFIFPGSPRLGLK